MINRELDLVGSFLRLDDRQTGRVYRILGAAPAQPLAIEDIAHRQDSLEGVALRAPRRADIRLARRYTDRVVADRADRLRRNTGAVVLNEDRSRLRPDRY